jgi:hypothetical protein
MRIHADGPVEYFYGDALRWSFGFENPNKAAVIFVCVLPLLWGLWQMAWRLANPWLKLPTLAVTTGSLMVAWHCLSMTYSRGGLVAALVALIYLIGVSAWKDRKTRNGNQNAQWRMSALLIAAFMVCVFSNGLGARTSKAFKEDASVGNRIELWGSALQMSVENPLGSGSGKSGEQYMNWYQPEGRKEAYRTMVNSYLTFLVERGWLKFGVLLVAFVLFWSWTVPGEKSGFPWALRAGLLGFLTAGVFSTTMEERLLWIGPAVSGGWLMLSAAIQKTTLPHRHLMMTGGCVLTGCLVLIGTGFYKKSKDPLARHFSKTGNHRTLEAIGAKNSAHSLGCVVDDEILGAQYPKLLQELALKAHVKLTLGEHAKKEDRVLFVGKQVHAASGFSANRLLLLAPEKITESELKVFQAEHRSLSLILPEIDEDGRVGFWTRAAETEPQRFTQITLNQVGNRVDWAWDQVIEIVKKSDSSGTSG